MMIFVVMLPILLGVAALAVDIGNYAGHRRSLQNAADSIALAAARDLPDATAAQTTAQAYTAKAGLSWSDVTFTVTPQSAGNPNPKVSVNVARPHGFGFMRALGVTSATVRAHAAAIKTSPGGGARLTPWAVTQTTLQFITPGLEVTLKYDATNPTTGNFGAIQIDGMWQRFDQSQKG